MNESFKIVDNDINIIKKDKTDDHKEMIGSDLESSIKNTIIQSNNYFEHNMSEKDTKNTYDSKHNISKKDICCSQTNDEIRQNNLTNSSRDEKKIYDLVENNVALSETIGGAAGSAVIKDVAAIIKNPDKSELNKQLINEELSQRIKSDMIKPDEAKIIANKMNRTKDINEKTSLVRTVAGVIGQEIDTAIGSGGGDNSLSDRSNGLAVKYGYKAGKYTAIGTFAIGRGTYRIAKLGTKLSRNVKKGLISGREARKTLLSHSVKSIKESSVSIGKVIKGGTERAVEDFRGSDDLGMQALTKPKDAIIKTKRTLKIAKTTGRTLAKGAKGTFKASKSIAKKTATATKHVVRFAKKVFTNPVVLKGVAIVGGIILLAAMMVSVVSSITSIIPSISLKSEEWELTQTYAYITELDARMEEDIINEDTKLHIPSVDEYRYYYNGVQTSKDNMTVYTDADLMLMYFDSKYDDYQLDKILLFFGGTSVRNEIKKIHAALYQVEKVRWIEEIEHKSSYTDPETGEEIVNSWIEHVYHMDIYLTTKPFKDYIEENKATLLTKQEADKLEALQEAGVYTMRKEIGSPFVGVDWPTKLTSRFGWRIHPISKTLSFHPALDLSMPEGTPINSCMDGTVTVSYDGDGYGNYVIVKNSKGDYTLYAHMSSVAVSNDVKVKVGDVIGYVGTTGSSTGNHLHIEYIKGDKNLNPMFFMENDVAE